MRSPLCVCVQFNSKITFSVAIVLFLLAVLIKTLWFSQYTIIFFLLHSRLLAQTSSTTSAVTGWIGQKPLSAQREKKSDSSPLAHPLM